MVTLALPDADATARAGATLAPLLEVGDVVALLGDLGAGKTALTSAVVAALGAPAAAASPTFALVHRYPGGRLLVWHVDLYRVEHPRELPELGLDDVLGARRGADAGVAFVEWADRFPAVLPAAYVQATLVHAEVGRVLTLVGHGPRGEALAAAWAAACALGA
ncbi:MAG: tRNA (adenosine(37)-N6)-threonylcarbamoyltransferase complex ATPase subunit type 1 TsaE [Kofleriaceae bacterium]